MKIQDYQNAHLFLEELEPILLEQEAVNQLLLNNATHLKDKEVSSDHFFGKATSDDGAILLIFLHMSPFNVLVCERVPFSLELVEYFVTHVLSLGVEVRGINASYLFASNFCARMKEKTGRTFYQRLAMDIMVCKKLNPVTLPLGRFRLATRDDFNLLNHWYVAFVQEAMGDTASIEEVTEKNKSKIEEEKLHFYEDEYGQVVSMAISSRILKKGVSISLVYTDPSKRNKGYGMAVTYHLTQKILKMGNEYATLFVDKMNPISNRVYLKLGYEIIQENYDFRFEEK